MLELHALVLIVPRSADQVRQNIRSPRVTTASTLTLLRRIMIICDAANDHGDLL